MLMRMTELKGRVVVDPTTARKRGVVVDVLVDIDQHVHDDPALASGGRIDDDASLELCHAHQHPSLHMVVCGPLWASRRLAGKPRLNTKLLLGWADLAEGGVDE